MSRPVSILVPLNRKPPEGTPDEPDGGVRLTTTTTFVECFPKKVRTGGPHPHKIVETTSMNAVDPPNVTISLAIPEIWIDNGRLSCVQMEAVIYACQSHEQFLPDGQRRGFLIGDGAGVGKGRTIAGIIIHNYELGRKRAIWLSVSTDLRFDAQRDIEDVAGAGYCPIYLLNKFKYGKIREQNCSKGIMFSTYASLIGKSKTGESRLNQLIEWFGKDYDGVLIFDECHRAKNLCPKAGTTGSSLIGRYVVELQRKLPKARVVYASATGATEPRNMAYMERLGMWGAGTAFKEFVDFLNVIERRGMGAMELVAMDMKRRGLYIARQLSFHGVDFDVYEVPLTAEYKKVYDDAVAFWAELQNQFTKAFNVLHLHKKKTFKSAWTHFYSTCQRFFKHLCIAVKVPMCVEITKKAIEQGKCVVIGLQSTGESQTNEALDEVDGELEEFVSTPKQLLITLIEKYFPIDLDGEIDERDPMKALFNSIDAEERRWKRKNNIPLDYAILQKEAKRKKLEELDEEMDEEDDDGEEDDEDSSGSSSGEESDDEESESSESSVEENGATDLVNVLMNELGSDSSDDEHHSDTEDSTKRYDEDDESAALSLFCMDFNGKIEDPWAHRQKVIDDRKDKNMNKKMKPVVKNEKRKKKKKQKSSKIFDVAKSLAEEFKTDTVESTSTSSVENDNNELLKLDLMKIPKEEINVTLMSIKDELLDRAKKIGETLPINTLDALIDQLGGSEKVAEMTGRRGRVIRLSDGTTGYQRRNDGENINLDLINIQEKDHFMNGDKLVAIISEAASSGISLHADKRAPNKRKRVHITMELPWSADRAVQQFGRTHRSNQEYPPEYLFLISELAGEKRFVSTASKRLQSLGALTHGDRRAVAESDDLGRFSIENKYGLRAMNSLFQYFLNPNSNRPCPPRNELGNKEFYEFARSHMERVGIIKKVNGTYVIDRENAGMNKFLNRLLLMPVDVQNAIFDYFMALFDCIVRLCKNEGTYDNGTMDLGAGSDVVSKADTKVFQGLQSGMPFEVLLHRVQIDRGMSWNDVSAIAKIHNRGIFVYNLMPKTNRMSVYFVYGMENSNVWYVVRPNMGRIQKHGSMTQFIANHRRFTNLDDAKQAWDYQYEATKTMCHHKFSLGNEHETCEIGRRIRTYYVLGGAVLSAWKAVEAAIPPKKHGGHIQIVRIPTDQEKLVGVLVAPQTVNGLLRELGTNYNARLVRTY